MVFTVPPDLLLPPVNTAVIQSATLFLHLHVCSGGLGAADGDRGARGPPQVCGPVHVTHQGEGLLGPWLGESLEIGHSATYLNPRVLSSEAWGPWRTQFEIYHPGEKLPFPERTIPRHGLQEFWIHFLPPTTSTPGSLLTHSLDVCLSWLASSEADKAQVAPLSKAFGMRCSSFAKTAEGCPVLLPCTLHMCPVTAPPTYLEVTGLPPCFSGCLRADQTPGSAFTHLRCPGPLTGPSTRVMICDGIYLSVLTARSGRIAPNSSGWWSWGRRGLELRAIVKKILMPECLHVECTQVILRACSVAQLCPTLCDPMDCSLLGSFVHGILQARMGWRLPCPFPGYLSDQGSNLHLLRPLHQQVGSLLLVPPGKPPHVIPVIYKTTLNDGNPPSPAGTSNGMSII